MYTHALNDYTTPAAELLKIVREYLQLRDEKEKEPIDIKDLSPELQKTRSACYELFVFILYTLTGKGIFFFSYFF